MEAAWQQHDEAQRAPNGVAQRAREGVQELAKSSAPELDTLAAVVVSLSFAVADLADAVGDIEEGRARVRRRPREMVGGSE